LPNITWGTIFGEPYINMFGKEKLLNTPCYKTETIGEKAVFLQASESIFNPVEENIKNKIKKYLDEDAFVWGGKDYRSYKTGKVPEFDFSEILYDKAKLIIEPQVKTRQR